MKVKGIVGALGPSTWLATVAICVMFCSAAMAQAPLPAEVQAALLRNQIVASAKANDLKGALVAIDEYRKLAVDFPPTLLLVEAKAASKTGDPVRALSALQKFLTNADRKSTQYQEALLLYPNFSSAAQPAIEARARELKALNLAEVPAGAFKMGTASPGKDRGDESPQHQVEVKAFVTSKFPVTRDEFQAFVNETGYQTGTSCISRAQSDTYTYGDGSYSWQRLAFDQAGRAPVVCVTWDDATAYAKYLSHKTGHNYRLLTEAEMEYAIRAGTQTEYFWGETKQAGCGAFRNCDSKVPEAAFAVGSYSPNSFGLYDFGRGLNFWTEDCYHPSYEGAPLDGSAWTAGGCSERASRGSESSAYRGNHKNHSFSIDWMAFRLVRSD